MIEGLKRSWQVMEGQKRSWMVSHHFGLTLQVRKLMGGVGGGWWWHVGLYVVSAPVPVPFLWNLDLGFGTWILDLNAEPRLGTWIWDWTWA